MPNEGIDRPQGTFKKLINDPFQVVDEALEGLVAAHADLVALAAPRVVARRAPATDKVGVVVGGGSGHEPAFAGYVGQGLADAAACGNIFASPSADVGLAAIRAASSGRGVVLAYGNYAGDIMNFGLAAELAAAEGIEVRQVLQDVQAMGGVVKDLETGLVDFSGRGPAGPGGPVVNLCWKLGEDAVRFWHGMDEGFAQRKPLP